MTATTKIRVVTTQVYQVYIKATPEAIWDAITKPERAQSYGYADRVDYDLRPGGAYRALASQEFWEIGALEVIVEGKVLEADPPSKLVQTWNPVRDQEIAAEALSLLTWEIDQGEGGVTKLTVTHELVGAPKAAAQIAGAGDGAGGGWSYILSDLKTLLETGAPLYG
jgi:uncharacterized protein YndB with AHSA1/START domain